MSYGNLLSWALPGAGADIRILAQAKPKKIIKKKMKYYSTRVADWKSSLYCGCDSKLKPQNLIHATYDGPATDKEVELAGRRPRATVASRRNTAECLQMRTLDPPRKATLS